MAIKPEAPQGSGKEASGEINDVEILPFQRQESEAVQNLTEKYAEGAEISDKSRKILDGFLAKDTEEGYRIFAATWFEDHKDQIQKEKGVPVGDVSAEWKANIVLSPREKGGMGAAAEIKEGKYKSIGDEIDKIGILRVDLAKKQIPPETPFLLLNYLQKSIDGEKVKIEALKAKAEKGDTSAGVEAAGIEKQLADLHTARRELVEKIMHEDLNKTAEQRVAGTVLPKDKFVESEFKATSREIESKRNDELIDAEWQRYMNLPEKQRVKYQKELGCKLEISREQFDKDRIKRGNYGPEQEDRAYKNINREMFRDRIMDRAKKNGIEEQTFYSMLEGGFKPHEAKIKGFKFLGTEKLLVPVRGGSIREVPARPEFFENIVDERAEKIEAQAKRELEEFWDKEYAERIKDEIEARIGELAQAPEAAEGGIKETYKKARERIITEYVKKRAEKEPKTQEQLAELEKKFKKAGKPKNIDDFMADVLFKKGRLENLGDNFDKDDRREIGGFLRSWGISADIRDTEGISAREYVEARKTHTGFFAFIMKIIEGSLKPKTLKKRQSRKK